MNKKILFSVFALTPMVANAAIPYRVEMVQMPVLVSESGNDSERSNRYDGKQYLYS